MRDFLPTLSLYDIFKSLVSVKCGPEHAPKLIMFSLNVSCVFNSADEKK